MDPATIVGIASGTVALLKSILEVSPGLQTAIRDIQSIDVNTENLVGEVDAFHFVLVAFQTELQTSELVPDVRRWWNVAQLDELLMNAQKTLHRLDAIIKEVGKQRSVLSALRQYWRTRGYDKEFQHLRLRIGTFITALRIPIDLGRIYSIRQDLAFRDSSTQYVQQHTKSQQHMDVLAVQLLGDRIVQLESSIHALSSNLKSSQNKEIDDLPSNLRKETERLIDIAHTLAQSTASTSSEISEGSSVQTPTIVHVEKRDHDSVMIDDEIGYASSLHGTPIGPQARQRISAWISEISSTATPTVRDISGALTNASLELEPVSSQRTAPSTVRRSTNLRAQLAAVRLKKAGDFMAQKNFEKAVPLFQRSLEEMKSNPGFFKPELSNRRLLLNLAKAMVKSNHDQGAVEPVLRSVLDSSESSPEERAEASHRLASLFLNNDTKLQESKDLCESAASVRAEIFGLDDPKTHQSIATIVLICRKLQDPDEEVWVDMLPESYETPSYSLTTPSVMTLNPKFHNESDRLSAMAFSSDGKLLVTVNSLPSMNSINIWNSLSGAVVQMHKVADIRLQKIYRMASSPNGRLLAIASKYDDHNPIYLLDSHSGSLHLVNWDWIVDDGHSLRTKFGSYHVFTALAFSPDGTLFASATNISKSILLFKCENQKIVFLNIIGPASSNYSTALTVIAFSPDSQLLASIDNSVQNIVLSNTRSRLPVRTFQVLQFSSKGGCLINAIAFSPNGRFLAISEVLSKTVILLDSVLGDLLQTFDSHLFNIRSIAFSGRLLMAAGFKTDEQRNIKLWQSRIELS